MYLLSTRIIYTRTHLYQRTSYSVVLNILFHTLTYIFTPGIISVFSIPAVHVHVPVMCLKIFINLKKEIILVYFILSQLIKHIYSEVEIICKMKNCQCIKNIL